MKPVESNYRYTWLRSSTFMLWGLYTLGLDREADDFFYFLADLAQQQDDLQIMYGIGGEHELTEQVLDHLSGYDGARPVRIGNGAWNQRLHDVWGVLLDSIYLHHPIPGPARRAALANGDAPGRGRHQALARPRPGLWQVRGPARHFTASKILCWVAADRGIKLAELRGDGARAAEWRQAADEIHADVCAHGTDERGVFCQHYDTTALDASLLLIPLVGFLPPGDARVRKTVLAIADELTEDELGGTWGTSRKPSPTSRSSTPSCTSSTRISASDRPRPPGTAWIRPDVRQGTMCLPVRRRYRDGRMPDEQPDRIWSLGLRARRRRGSGRGSRARAGEAARSAGAEDSARSLWGGIAVWPGPPGGARRRRQ
jgi:hypothetical protein